MIFRLASEPIELQEWLFLGIFLLSFLLQMVFYLGIFLRFYLHKPGKERGQSKEKALSVIICARNEKENLERFLPRVLLQDYPEFEVVVVNDSSTDGSEELLQEMSQQYGHLRFTSIPPSEKLARSKKLALTIGIKSAKYEWVVLTDADCYPATEKWLYHMASGLSDQKHIVLGYGAYEKRKGILNGLIRYETVFTAMQYFSWAIRGKPYMGVGRNLAYKRELFFESKGFAGHYHIPSGDDDLFVNENANAANTEVIYDREAHTISPPKSTVHAWIRQKRRHISAGKLYRKGSRFRLAGEWSSRILLYISFLLLSTGGPFFYAALIPFAIWMVTRLLIFQLSASRLGEKQLFLPSLLFDPVMPFILGAIWLSILFESKYQTWS